MNTDFECKSDRSAQAPTLARDPLIKAKRRARRSLLDACIAAVVSVISSASICAHLWTKMLGLQ
jgi:hypothetical protein